MTGVQYRALVINANPNAKDRPVCSQWRTARNIPSCSAGASTALPALHSALLSVPPSAALHHSLPKVPQALSSPRQLGGGAWSVLGEGLPASLRTSPYHVPWLLSWLMHGHCGRPLGHNTPQWWVSQEIWRTVCDSGTLEAKWLINQGHGWLSNCSCSITLLSGRSDHGVQAILTIHECWLGSHGRRMSPYR